MTVSFNQIENDFLEIEPLESKDLDNFYLKYKDYFDNELPEDEEARKVFFTMLCEIGNSYSFTGRHHEALKVLRSAEIKLKRYTTKLELEPDHNQIVFGLANSYYSTGHYVKALQHFKRYKPSTGEKIKIDTIINICKSKVRSKLFYAIGTLGLIILVIKYLIKWKFPEYYTAGIQYGGTIGAIFILFGSIGILTKKKETTANNG